MLYTERFDNDLSNYTYFFILLGSNIYGAYESLSTKNYYQAVPYVIYSLSLVTAVISLIVGETYLIKAKEMLKEANNLHSNDDKKIRMEMHEKLLEDKEEGVQ